LGAALVPTIAATTVHGIGHFVMRDRTSWCACWTTRAAIEAPLGGSG
jgi:hypothetical protein